MIHAHYKQSIAKHNSNLLRGSAGILFAMVERVKRTAREIVATNLKRLMDTSLELKTQGKAGKKAGVSQRAVGYLLQPDTGDMKSPKLETVEKVARAFDLEPWQLLIDPETFGQELTTHLQRPKIPNERGARWRSQPITDQPRPVTATKGKQRSTV